MHDCDVLIVGGGPAGSSCARRLCAAGIDTIVLDQAAFPRDKVCGGWVTPAVMRSLEIDTVDYSRGRVLQPIDGFQIGVSPGCSHLVKYPSAVSYGIRRLEFDDYLLRRSGARLFERTPASTLERRDRTWVVNGRFRSRRLIGAGGHFCPVARHLGARPGSEQAVIAQRVEYLLEDPDSCPVAEGIPELYFCADLRGYGWCFRKAAYLNIGFGRLDRRDFAQHRNAFLAFLADSLGIVPERRLEGHAYLVYPVSRRALFWEGVLVIGDAAGVALPFSGEGIGPAVLSGFAAADTLIAGRDLSSYPELLAQRMGTRESGGLASALPANMLAFAARVLLKNSRSFCRAVLNQRFLRAG